MTALSSLRLPSLALLLALPLGACVLHLGDDDDVPCAGIPTGDGTAGDVAGTLLVDPSTLACVEFGFGTCNDACGPCPEPLPPIPSWGACQSQCTGLSEIACTNTPGCRTTYDDACLRTDGPCPLLTPFLGCFAVDTTGPIQGACDGLDATECSRHDDCLATYRDNGLCDNAIDDDRDGLVDDLDECKQFAVCMAEIGGE